MRAVWSARRGSRKIRAASAAIDAPCRSARACRHGSQDTAQDLERPRRAALNRAVDRNHIRDPATARVALTEDAARAPAVAHCDNEFRGGRGVIGALDRDFHVARHRSGHQQQVGMAWTRDEADAIALEVVIRIVERVDLELAAVARAGVDLADRQRTAEEREQIGLNALRLEWPSRLAAR